MYFLPGTDNNIARILAKDEKSANRAGQ